MASFLIISEACLLVPINKTFPLEAASLRKFTASFNLVSV